MPGKKLMQRRGHGSRPTGGFVTGMSAWGWAGMQILYSHNGWLSVVGRFPLLIYTIDNHLDAEVVFRHFFFSFSVASMPAFFRTRPGNNLKASQRPANETRWGQAGLLPKTHMPSSAGPARPGS
jgi:hypothetical protein